MIFGEIKLDTLEPLPHVTPKGENKKIVISEGQKKVHTSIIPGPK